MDKTNTGDMEMDVRNYKKEEFIWWIRMPEERKCVLEDPKVRFLPDATF